LTSGRRSNKRLAELYKEVFRYLGSSQNIIRVIKSERVRWVRLAARIRDMRSIYKIVVGKSEGNRTFVRPRRRWEFNI